VNNTGMKLFWIACIGLLLARGAWAGPLDTGDTAYKAGQYAQAASAYQAAITQGPTGTGAEQAKAYYKLGNAYHKLGQPSQALQAYQQAQTIDPTLSFASSPDKFRAAVARVQPGTSPVAATGRSAPGNINPAGAAPAGRDAAYQTLTSSNVYISGGVPGVTERALEQAAVQGRENPHTVVKIAVLDRLPPQYTSAASYAGILHKDLALGKNGLVAVAWQGRGAGVGVATDGLSEAENTRLAQQYAPQIAANPGVGIPALAQAVASDINNKEYGKVSIMWLVFFIIVAIVAALLISATRKRKAQLGSAKASLAPLRQYVLESIGYLDGYAGVMPRGNPNSARVMALRQSASEKYDQAEKIMDNATADTDMARAQQLFTNARADCDNARKALDAALGGTANIPGDDAMRPKPLPETQAQVQAVPADQRGASFFSSRPAPLGSLVPVSVTIDGQTKQVLATPEEAAELRAGRMPAVRAFNVNGQQVPWYAYNQYDPYNDYWRYQNAGWGGFGGGVVADLIAMDLMSHAFAPNYYGYGWGGGAFSTDNDYYRGYYDAERSNQAYGSSFGDNSANYAPDNAGGASFLQSGGPGYDTGGYGSGGGGSFPGGGSDRS